MEAGTTSPVPARNRTGTLGRNIELLAALALGCIYLAVACGHILNIDGYLMFNQAKSIVFDHSLLFREPIAGITTSKYGLGTSMVYVPGLLLFSGLDWTPEWPAGPVAASEQWALPFYNDPLYLLVGSPVQILITVATAFLVAHFIRELEFGRSAALSALVLYGLGSPAFVYAHQDTSQPLVGLCWVAALYWALLYRRGRSVALWGCVGSYFYAVLMRPVEGLLLLPAVLLMLAGDFRFRSWSPLEWRAMRYLFAASIAALGVMGMINWGRYGSPFISGYGGEHWQLGTLGIGLAGSLISPGRGIIWEFPALVLVPLGLRTLWNRDQKGVALTLVGLAFLQLLNVAAWDVWWGGWDYGLRLFVPALPLLAVIIGCGLEGISSAARRWLVPVLLALGLLWTVPGVLTDMNSGYAYTYDGAEPSFRVDAYLPIGAWPYFDHWRATSVVDFHAADILWLRFARPTNNTSLIVPALLLFLALGLTARVMALQRLVPQAREPGLSEPSPSDSPIS